MELFEYTDTDDDTLNVEAREGQPGWLFFRIPADNTNELDGRGVDIPRETVQRLHQALGEWLFPVAPGTPDTTLLETMVKKAAEDAVTAILPLHLKPVAYTPEPDAEDGWQRADPSPHDAGHPEPLCTRNRPEDAHPASRCTWCGHLWSVHAPSAPVPGCTCGHWVGWHGTDGCTRSGCGCTWTGGVADVPEDHGRLMSELPRRVRPKVECTCEHRFVRGHGALGCNARSCTCRWTGTGTP